MTKYFAMYIESTQQFYISADTNSFTRSVFFPKTWVRVAYRKLFAFGEISLSDGHTPTCQTLKPIRLARLQRRETRAKILAHALVHCSTWRRIPWLSKCLSFSLKARLHWRFLRRSLLRFQARFQIARVNYHRGIASSLHG